MCQSHDSDKGMNGTRKLGQLYRLNEKVTNNDGRLNKLITLIMPPTIQASYILRDEEYQQYDTQKHIEQYKYQVY